MRAGRCGGHDVYAVVRGGAFCGPVGWRREFCGSGEALLGITGKLMSPSTHEEYFAGASPEVRHLLQAIQKKVEELLPNASRCISYRMPAFKQDRVFFCFAAFKKHIGVYPPVTNDAALIKELKPYRGEKGNLSFPLGEPLPFELIGRVALALAREYASK
jgi:uncharacterized protein YdhG (YjbR/CyaY superfamily)